jgi:hypothetical protein
MGRVAASSNARTPISGTDMLMSLN